VADIASLWFVRSQPTEERGRHGTHPVPSYRAVRHHSSAEEGHLTRALYWSTSSDCGLRITKDVPVVWGDYCAVKTILLGMWRVAASSLAGISAAEAAEAEYDRPVR
jgi:hypothetical protein